MVIRAGQFAVDLRKYRKRDYLGMTIFHSRLKISIENIGWISLLTGTGAQCRFPFKEAQN